MARIKIKDLPKDQTITKDEMKKVMGGIIIICKLPSITPSQMTPGYNQSGIITYTSPLFTET